MYKHKYYKYKTKYLNMRSSFQGGTYLANEDVDDESDLGQDEEFIETDSDEITESVDMTTDTTSYNPYNDLDTDKESIKVYDSEEVTVDEPDEPELEDIGEYGPISSIAKGRSVPLDEFSDDDYIHFNDKYVKDKILKLDTVDDFDNFTEKYGYVQKFKDQQVLIIKWNDVLKEYKGITVNEGLLAQRQDDVFFNGHTYDSWLGDEILFNIFKDGSVFVFQQ